jgi:hypothetical protein
MVVRFMPRLPYPWGSPRMPIQYEAEWDSKSSLYAVDKRKIYALTGSQNPAIQPLATHDNDWVITSLIQPISLLGT